MKVRIIPNWYDTWIKRPWGNGEIPLAREMQKLQGKWVKVREDYWFSNQFALVGSFARVHIGEIDAIDLEDFESLEAWWQHVLNDVALRYPFGQENYDSTWDEIKFKTEWKMIELYKKGEKIS